VPWEVVLSEKVEEWLKQGDLSEKERRAFVAATDLLTQEGPDLGRPIVDRIEGSTIHNMKELRPLGTAVRVLFVFDPQRRAVLLVGGNKRGKWDRWYRDAIPQAERLYEKLRKEGV
jgi:hypothetical protein